MDSSVVFNRKNWAYLAEAVTTNSDSNVVGTELANRAKMHMKSKTDARKLVRALNQDAEGSLY